MRKGNPSSAAIVAALIAGGSLIGGCGGGGSGAATAPTTSTPSAAPRSVSQNAAPPTATTSRLQRANRVTAATNTNQAAGRESPASARAIFVARADNICASANRLIAAAAKKTLPNEAVRSSEAQIRRYGRLVASILLNQLELMRRLPAPPADKARVTEILNVLGGDVEKAQAEPASVSGPYALRRFTSLAHADGLAFCGG